MILGPLDYHWTATSSIDYHSLSVSLPRSSPSWAKLNKNYIAQTPLSVAASKIHSLPPLSSPLPRRGKLTSNPPPISVSTHTFFPLGKTNFSLSFQRSRPRTPRTLYSHITLFLFTTLPYFSHIYTHTPYTPFFIKLFYTLFL